jgi:hypothetical protein
MNRLVFVKETRCFYEVGTEVLNTTYYSDDIRAVSCSPTKTSCIVTQFERMYSKWRAVTRRRAVGPVASRWDSSAEAFPLYCNEMNVRSMMLFECEPNHVQVHSYINLFFIL